VDTPPDKISIKHGRIAFLTQGNVDGIHSMFVAPVPDGIQIWVSKSTKNPNDYISQTHTLDDNQVEALAKHLTKLVIERKQARVLDELKHEKAKRDARSLDVMVVDYGAGVAFAGTVAQAIRDGKPIKPTLADIFRNLVGTEPDSIEEIYGAAMVWGRELCFHQALLIAQKLRDFSRNEPDMTDSGKDVLINRLCAELDWWENFKFC
jgi:hypothetical protein